MGGIRYKKFWFEENNYSKTNAESPDRNVLELLRFIRVPEQNFYDLVLQLTKKHLVQMLLFKFVIKFFGIHYEECLQAAAQRRRAEETSWVRPCDYKWINNFFKCAHQKSRWKFGMRHFKSYNHPMTISAPNLQRSDNYWGKLFQNHFDGSNKN